MTDQYTTVDDYIRAFPEDVSTVLATVRATIRTVVPHAQETMSYQMPTYVLDGRRVVHFAAWKSYLSVYPLPTGDEAFQRDIAPFRAAKSTVRFPYSSSIPYDLIARQVSLLVARAEDPAP